MLIITIFVKNLSHLFFLKKKTTWEILLQNYPHFHIKKKFLNSLTTFGIRIMLNISLHMQKFKQLLNMHIVQERMYSSIFIFISYGFTDRKKKKKDTLSFKYEVSTISGEGFYNK